MADVASWSWTGTDTSLPGTAWADMQTITWTEDRNDITGGSISGPSITLPAAGTDHAWLVTSSYEFEDDSNGRHGPQMRFVQDSGDGTFQTGWGSGYNRDDSEDRAYVGSFAVLDESSTSSVVTIQWRRDVDVPTGGLRQWYAQAVLIPRDEIGIYASTNTDGHDDATPTQVTGFSTVKESNASIIARATDQVNINDNGRRYLVLGSQRLDASWSARTQRIMGLRQDGVLIPDAQGYVYLRSSANNQQAAVYSTIIESDGSTNVDSFQYLGSSTASASTDGGPEAVGGTSYSNADHVMIVLALPSSAEVFRGNSSADSGTNLETTAQVEIPWNANEIISGDDAFDKNTSDYVTANNTTDVLVGFNLRGRAKTFQTTRFTGYSNVTVNGTEVSEIMDGAYLRNDQSTSGTYGYRHNLLV